jgi:hypothetical protein
MDELRKYEKELDELLSKREAMRAQHMQKYRDGSATRAQTTTHNANVAWVNERIEHVRQQIRLLKVAA